MASIAFPEHSKSLNMSDGTKYGYIFLAPAAKQPTLLLLHGYPSSSYHWHNQVSQCQSSGYGLIAPDLLGYGDTSKPANKAAYDNTIIAAHVIQLLDAEKVATCIAVGHDWGSVFLSTLARLHPERFDMLVFTTVGYVPSQAPFLDVEAVNRKVMEALGRPTFGYWVFHNREDCASVLENADPLCRASLLFPADPNIWIQNFCEPGGMEAWFVEKKTTDLAPWVSQAELEMHGQIMTKGGFTGPLNWYRQAMAGITHASEARVDPEYSKTKFEIPTLFVGCTKDVICIPQFQVQAMKDCFKNLTVKDLETSHWCMLEQPKEFWEVLSGWIEEKMKTK